MAGEPCTLSVSDDVDDTRDAWGPRRPLAAGSSPFASPTFTLELPALLSPDMHPHCWRAETADGELRAVLPIALSRRRIGPWVFRHAEPFVRWHASVTEATVAHGAESCLDAILTRWQGVDTWDVFEARAVDPDSPLARAAVRVGMRVLADDPGLTVDLGRPVHQLSAGRVKELRRLLRRHHEQHGTTIETMTVADPLWPEIGRTFARLHARRWAATPTPSPLADPAIARRFATWLDAAGRHGEIRVLALRNEGSLHGLLLLLDDGTEVHAWRLAYDAALRPIGPGMQLVRHAVDQAQETGRIRFHFGRGTQHYKEAWSPRPTARSRLFWHRPSLASRVVRALGNLSGRHWLSAYHG